MSKIDTLTTDTANSATLPALLTDETLLTTSNHSQGSEPSRLPVAFRLPVYDGRFFQYWQIMGLKPVR